VANPEHLAKIKEGREAWNQWRYGNPILQPDLSGADLKEAKLSGAHLNGTDLEEAILVGAKLYKAELVGAKLAKARLMGADLTGADLDTADLRGANLTGAILIRALLINTNLQEAILKDCWVFGISAWNVDLEGAAQSNLVITPPGESMIQVDNLEVAQFVYLLLNNKKIRDVIDTIGKTAVLILGRFGERKFVLEKIRSELRSGGYLPIVFDFERPTDRDFTETVLTLAGMSRFIIADLTRPRSVPLESQVVIPNYMIPMVPIIQKGEEPFSMFADLWRKHREWVLEPLEYKSVDQLAMVFTDAVIRPAEDRLKEQQRRKAEALIMRDASEYE
jgi:hypothetical protein